MFQDITEDTIRVLVNQFYGQIRKDPRLGLIFSSHIASHEWDDHLDRMVLFWHSVMLASGRYKGSPMQKHMRITEATPEDFAAWLELFHKTAHHLYIPSLADAFVKKAEMIAESLKYGLFYSPSDG